MRVLCLGDSNTYGYDPRGAFGGRYAPEDRWVDRVAKQTGWEMINAGFNGQEIPRNAHTVPFPIGNQNADMLLIMLGTNDLLQGATAKESAARMEAFLNSLLPYEKQLLLIAPPPVKRGAWVDSGKLVTESILLAEEYKNLAHKQKIPFLDTHRWNIPLAFDGVHFTEEGHHAFANRFLMEASPWII